MFITYALYAQLQNEDQLAGVLGHEIGHVLGRHSSERIANTELWQTVAQGADVGAGYNPREMIQVMEILKAAAGPNRAPEFKSTHPDPDNRIQKIEEAIVKYGG